MNYITGLLKTGAIDLKERPQSIIITMIQILSPFGLLIIALIFWFLTMNSSNSGNNKNIKLWKRVKARVMTPADKKQDNI